MRNTLLKAISKKIISDNKLIVLLGDLGVYQMREAMKNYPSQVINFGIMEQTMIGFSAGIAKGDYYPIIYSITPFLIDRAYEQIKLDLIYNNSNALILSAGASFDYSTLGPTHHCPHDITNLLSINHPFLSHPFTKLQSVNILNDILKNKLQAYIRISSSELDFSKYPNFQKSEIRYKRSNLKLFDEFIYKNSSKTDTLVILFGPDSAFLKNFNHHINNCDSLITVSVITESLFKDLGNQIKKFEKVFIFIPYDPAQVILKLISIITSFKENPANLVIFHPKAIFYDNSYEKKYIFEFNTEETRII